MDNSKSRKFELLLITLITARSTSFVFSKIILEGMGTFNLLAVRFLMAFVILAILFSKRLFRSNRKTIVAGLITGVAYFFVMSSELKALTTAPSSVVALLENSAIFIVPIFEAVLKKRLPSRMTSVCALLGTVGVLCLFFDSGRITGGMLWGLLCAILYSVAIIVIDRVVKDVDDALCVGIIEVGTMGVLSLLASFAVEDTHLPSSIGIWGMIAYLAIVCTGFGFTLQPVAQKYVSSERTGLFCAVEPAVATLLGVVILSEKIGLLSVLGFVLIILCIILPYIKFSKKEEKKI